MFLGAVYDIEAQIPASATTGYGPWSDGPEIFQALPTLMDWYLKLKQGYLSLQAQSLTLNPMTQAAQLKELSDDSQRLIRRATALSSTFFYTITESHWYDPAVVSYAKQLIEKAGVQNDGNFTYAYKSLTEKLATLTGQTVAALQVTTAQVSQFASIIASLKSQLAIANQQLTNTLATLDALRRQAASLGITSW